MNIASQACIQVSTKEIDIRIQIMSVPKKFLLCPSSSAEIENGRRRVAEQVLYNQQLQGGSHRIVLPLRVIADCW